MVKAYERINWENYPSDKTPLNESNLNKIDVALNEVDDRVITLDVTKLDKTTAAEMVKDVSFNEATGIFTITYLNGATITLDTKLEKLAVNFNWDAETQQLIIILDDGTKQYVDLSALITVYEFLDSDTIAFFIDDTGKVSAIVKEGSIGEKHLQPNYLADIKVESAKAETASTSAEAYAKTSRSYAVGGTGTRENEDTDNTLYYYEQVKDISKGMNGLIPMGTISFVELSIENNQVDKYMFNISDDFVTDDTFKEGAGHEYPAGSNVYRTSDGYWDCLAGNFVAGVRGAKELTPRQGFVVLTPQNIGALPEDGDSAENIVTFDSGDAVDSEDNPLAWTDVAVLKNGEKHSSILSKISTMFKNVRWLYKMLGTTDISSIGDGTCTGAIASQNETFTNQISSLNTDLQWKHWQDSAGTLVGGTHPTLSLPNSYQELLVVITPYSEGGDKSKNLTLNVPYLDLAESYKTYMTGEYYPPYADNVYSTGVAISKTSIYLDWTSMGSEDTTEYHYMSVYYR